MNGTYLDLLRKQKEQREEYERIQELKNDSLKDHQALFEFFGEQYIKAFIEFQIDFRKKH